MVTTIPKLDVFLHYRYGQSYPWWEPLFRIERSSASITENYLDGPWLTPPLCFLLPRTYIQGPTPTHTMTDDDDENDQQDSSNREEAIGPLENLTHGASLPHKMQQSVQQGDHHALLAMLWGRPPGDGTSNQSRHNNTTGLAEMALREATRQGQVDTLQSLLQMRARGWLVVGSGGGGTTTPPVSLNTAWLLDNDITNDAYLEDEDILVPGEQSASAPRHTTLLGLAARLEHSDCVQLLLQYGADPWYHPCHGHNDKDIAINNYPQPTTTDYPLWIACRYGRLDTVRCLLRSTSSTICPVPPFPTLVWILAHAVSLTCRYGHARLLTFWLRHAAVDDDTNLHTALPVVIRERLGRRPPDGVWSPWFDAAWHGHTACLHVLWQYTVDQTQNHSRSDDTSTGPPPCCCRCCCCCCCCRCWLLDQRGGTPWQRACAGTHPLRALAVWTDYVAVHGCHHHHVASLIVHADADGDTALSTAAWDDRTALLEWLLEHGVSPDHGETTAPDHEEFRLAVRRAMFHASDNGQVKALTLLLKYFFTDNVGTLPEDLEKRAAQSCVDRVILYAHHQALDDNAAGHHAVLRLLTRPPYCFPVTAGHVRRAVQLGRVECVHILLQAKPSLVTTVWEGVAVDTGNRNGKEEASNNGIVNNNDDTSNTKNHSKNADHINNNNNVDGRRTATKETTMIPLNILHVTAPLCQPNKKSHLEFLWFLLNLIVEKDLLGYFEETNVNHKTARESAVFAQHYTLAAVLSDPLLACRTRRDIQARLQAGNLTERGLTMPRMRRPPKGWTCLHTACCLGRTEVVEYLLALPGVNVVAATMNGTTPLHWAARHGHVAIGRQLLTHYSTMSVRHALQTGPASKVSALITAARHGQVALVQEMLRLTVSASDSGDDNDEEYPVFDVNAVDELDNTALYCATYEGHVDVVDTLLSAWTPLHCAVWVHNDERLWNLGTSQASFETLRTLVHWGANLNALDVDGKSPLELAEHPTVRLAMEALVRERVGRGNIYERGSLIEES